MKTLDMRFIRYLNLFDKITRVRTSNCFFYNNAIFFAVNRALISKAIGENGKNVKRMNEIIKRKIKIIALPRDASDAGRFISDIVEPIGFKNLEVNEKEIIIVAGSQSKAALIGRNKARLEEMKNIAKEYFNRELRIV